MGVGAVPKPSFGRSGGNYPALNSKIIGQLPIPLPPIAEQEEIVNRVNALLELTDEVETRVAAAGRHADKLTQAILAKAFRGELVPTEAELARREGREYEPADVMLKRIRAQRDDAEATPSKASRVRRGSSVTSAADRGRRLERAERLRVSGSR